MESLLDKFIEDNIVINTDLQYSFTVEYDKKILIDGYFDEETGIVYFDYLNEIEIIFFGITDQFVEKALIKIENILNVPDELKLIPKF